MKNFLSLHFSFDRQRFSEFALSNACYLSRGCMHRRLIDAFFFFFFLLFLQRWDRIQTRERYDNAIATQSRQRERSTRRIGKEGGGRQQPPLFESRLFLVQK